MSKKEVTERVQEVKEAKTVSRAMAIMIATVTGLAVLVITTIACWFLFSNIHGDARAAVIQDMQIVSKSQEQ